MVKRILQRVMQILSEEEPCTLSPDSILEIINEAQLKLVMYSDKTVTEEFILPKNEYEVYFPTDVFRFITAYWGDGREKTELAPGLGDPPYDDMFDEGGEDNIGSGDPKYYHIKSDKIIVLPSPTIDGYIYLVYVRRPPRITSPDDQLLFLDAEAFIVNYVVHQYYVEAGDFYTSREWEKRMEESLTEWVDRTNNQNYSRPLVIRARW